jgi:hypothetical protein
MAEDRRTVDSRKLEVRRAYYSNSQVQSIDQTDAMSLTVVGCIVVEEAKMQAAWASLCGCVEEFL